MGSLISASATISSLIVGGLQIPRGVFYLPSNQTIDSDALNNTNVDGLIIGADWAALEPTQGNYVFNTALSGEDTLDEMISAMNSSGKIARLAINTSYDHQPSWLHSMIDADDYTGGKTFSYFDDPVTRTIYVFWEPTLLARHAALVNAVASHLNDNPLVRIAYVPFCNARTNDFNPGSISSSPDGLPDGLSPEQRWVNTLTGSPYSTWQEAITYAGNYSFNAYRSAFPRLFLTTSIGRITSSVLNPDITGSNHGRNIYEDILSTANSATPGLVVAQKNNLKAGLSPTPGGSTAWNDLYQMSQLGIYTAAQMVWHAFNDCSIPGDPLNGSSFGADRMSPDNNCHGSTRSLVEAVDLGVGYETLWQEIYEPDILNLNSANSDPDPGPISDAIAYAKSVLNP